VAAVLARDGVALVLSDHGNAEQMIDRDTGQARTAHTTFPVPFVVIGRRYEGAGGGDPGAGGEDDRPGAGSAAPVPAWPPGILADVAPTVLDIMQLPAPPEMTGRSLLRPRTAPAERV
jgi:2,3-bisphosphoglycerate-independent phosphoglycerate mutase